MSPGPTFDRVYLALKEQLTGGRYAPGDHLEPVLIGEELHASITPVRDALHRLVGERLAEAPRNDGFRSPLLTEFGLRNLYSYNADLLLLALRHSRPRWSVPDPPAIPDGDPAASLFVAIGGLSTNAEHRDALMSTLARLGPARAAEPLVLEQPEGEIEYLRKALAGDDPADSRRAVAAYHRRRVRAAPLVLEAMYRRPRPD
ncbi:MAG TPA: GntR family transcriptional regulator [Allosphingosinicella sp.]|nr:GntR family transcriptional regulator [Allosphingosinicella sp.]